MAEITLDGNTIHTIGELPAVGSTGPDFRLTASDMSDRSLSNYAGKKKILNIVVSLDTGICADSAKKFNESVGKLQNTVVLTISRDLPFAQERFCNAQGIKSVETLSSLRDMSFGKDYGVEIIDGPFTGLLARSIVVLDENNKVLYTEQVPEIAQEPDYNRALEAL
jgi:thiol peroxidase